MRLAILVSWSVTVLLGGLMAWRTRPPLFPWLPHAILGSLGLMLWGIVVARPATGDSVAPQFSLVALVIGAGLGISLIVGRRRREDGRELSVAWNIAHGIGATTTLVLLAIAASRNLQGFGGTSPDYDGAWPLIVAGWLLAGAASAIAYRWVIPSGMRPVMQGLLGAISGLLAGVVAAFFMHMDALASVATALLGGVFGGWLISLIRFDSDTVEGPDETPRAARQSPSGARREGRHTEGTDTRPSRP